MKWTWRDVDEIAVDLVERYPNVDPMQVTLGELRQMVVGLPNFGDEPTAVSDAHLETIQAAWYDEFED